MLYHISLIRDKKVDIFQPRIPDVLGTKGDEDLSVPRISVSKSLDGCLSAVPWGGNQLNRWTDRKDGSITFRVYEFDEEDVKEGNLIEPYTLYSEYRVIDAQATGEHWVVNQTLKPRKVYEVKVTDWDEDYEDEISYEDLCRCEEEDLDEEEFMDVTTKIIINKYEKHEEEALRN